MNGYSIILKEFFVRPQLTESKIFERRREPEFEAHDSFTELQTVCLTNMAASTINLLNGIDNTRFQMKSYRIIDVISTSFLRE